MAFNLDDFYDAELIRLDPVFRAAFDVSPGDRVLDIGCGSGFSARQAARAAVRGSVLGVDISEDRLRVARQRSAEEELRNIAFEHGDAQVHPFPSAHFDLCISRFGTMFFDDPAAAFANIARALRPQARLAQLVWQGQERNEWSTAIQAALTGQQGACASAPATFSLGDRTATTRLLEAAGFAAIEFEEVHQPVFYGKDVDAALEAVGALFLPADKPASEGMLGRLRDLLQAHLTEEGVFFDSRAWTVTARRSAYRIG